MGQVATPGTTDVQGFVYSAFGHGSELQDSSPVAYPYSLDSHCLRYPVSEEAYSRQFINRGSLLLLANK
jgi:hypothetical protein